uniref:Uncharacterized protein n=1 Tax=Zea mays TaxID=4577 RepID=C0PB68_MAIZE|nr:unknown [Zea mays]
MGPVRISELYSHPLGPSSMTILKPSASPSCSATTFAAYRRLPRSSTCPSSAFDNLDSPYLTFAMIIICVGACGDMSLHARTCSYRHTNVTSQQFNCNHILH